MFSLVGMHLTHIKYYTSLLLVSHTELLSHVISIHRSSVESTFIWVLSLFSPFLEAVTRISVMKTSKFHSGQSCSLTTTPGFCLCRNLSTHPRNPTNGPTSWGREEGSSQRRTFPLHRMRVCLPKPSHLQVIQEWNIAWTRDMKKKPYWKVTGWGKRLGYPDLEISKREKPSTHSTRPCLPRTLCCLSDTSSPSSVSGLIDKHHSLIELLPETNRTTRDSEGLSFGWETSLKWY